MLWKENIIHFPINCPLQFIALVVDGIYGHNSRYLINTNQCDRLYKAPLFGHFTSLGIEHIISTGERINRRSTRYSITGNAT